MSLYTDFSRKHSIVVDYVMVICWCGERSDTRREHYEHVDRELKNAGLELVELPKPYPDDTVHPYWSVNDINGPQVIAVTDGDGSVQEDWVSIQFTARNRTVDAETARQLGLAFLAAANAAEANE